MSFTIKCDDGDLVSNVAGAYVAIGGLEKAGQDIAESLLNHWDPDLETHYNGSELYLVAGQVRVTAEIFPEEYIATAVTDALDRLQDLQDEDEFVDEDEKIEEIRGLTVRATGDLSYFFFFQAVTESFQLIPQNFDITLAQQLPEALAYDFDTFIQNNADGLLSFP